MAKDNNYKKTFEIWASDKTVKPISQIARRFDRLSRPIDKLNAKYRAGAQAIKPMAQRFERFGDRMQNFGQSASLAFTLPATAAGAATIATASDFEFAMKKVGVLSKASERQFKRLEERAMEIGASTQYAASDAAEGMQQLAVAGFDTDKILSAIKPTMNLAAAADMELGQTADTTSNILSAFKFQASETQNIVDKLTYAFTNSANRLDDLGEAYRLAGGVAKEAGVDFETVTAMLMSLGDVGHRGPSAGMAVQGAINRVLGFKKDVLAKNEVGKILVKYGIKPESYIDDQENVKFIKLIETLNEKKVGKDDFQTLFGGDYGKYIVSLRHVTSDLKDTIGLLKDRYGTWRGLSNSVANVYMEGAQGAINSFKASSEALMLSIGKSGLLDDFTSATNYLSEQIRGLSKLDNSTLRAGTWAVGGAASLGLGALAMGGISKLVASSLSGIAGAFTARQVFMALARTNLYTASLLGIASFTSWWLSENKEQITWLFDDFENWFKEKSDEMDKSLLRYDPKRGKGNNLYGHIASMIDAIRNYEPSGIADKSIHSWSWSKNMLETAPKTFIPDDYNLGIGYRNIPKDYSYKSPLQRRKGFIFSPFTERKYLPDLNYEAPRLRLPPKIKDKQSEQKLSFNFIFDEVPEQIKDIQIDAPREMIINKGIRRTFRGVYG